MPDFERVCYITLIALLSYLLALGLTKGMPAQEEHNFEYWLTVYEHTNKYIWDQDSFICADFVKTVINNSELWGFKDVYYVSIDP